MGEVITHLLFQNERACSRKSIDFTIFPFDISHSCFLPQEALQDNTVHF